ncbi:hypothetical protein [Mitsuaria sp. 7]|uniref:hypothetical protein n=1 Tax=Mitsuaria sp. 7 TaxID=1658665 RepID=UPI0008322561|nr:hypothetical protein [Mitsuaria sp. 7]
MDLSLSFQDNQTGHKDLVLRFAGQERICDSYYLVIDDGLPSVGEDERKIRAVLLRLLEQWLEVVQGLKAGEIGYLPYDLSDQYSGWLRCTATPDGYTLAQGWSTVEGWSFPPSDVGDLLHHLEGFRVDGPVLEVARDDLLSAIRASASLARQP